jgi:membrane protein
VAESAPRAADAVDPGLPAPGLALLGDERLARLPSRLQPLVRWLLAHWPGRIGLRTAAELARIQIFDRAMTVAAQFFTSVFPVVILLSGLAGRSYGSTVADQVGDAADLPPQADEVLRDAMHSGGIGAFGVVGTLIVLISATSLARALVRSFLTMWRLPALPRRLADAWRWLALVLVFALIVLLLRAVQRYVDPLPPEHLWQALLAAVVYGGIAVFAPWLLLSGRIPARRLLPGGVAFAIAMLVAGPLSQVYLRRALVTSAERFGSIGIAFTYLTWLYVVSFALLATAVLGQVITRDEGWLGSWIRGPQDAQAAGRAPGEPAQPRPEAL